VASRVHYNQLPQQQQSPVTPPNIPNIPRHRGDSESSDSGTSQADALVALTLLSVLQNLKATQQEINQIAETETKTETIVWEWKENDGTFKKYGDEAIKKLEQGKIGDTITLDATYEVVKKDQSNGTQTNKTTKVQRVCRRRVVNDDATASTEYQDLLQKFQKLQGQLQVLQDVIWEWQDDDGSWKAYTDASFLKKLEETIINEPIPLIVNGAQHFVVKSDDSNGEQRDSVSGKKRKVRRRAINKKSTEVSLPDWWVPTANNKSSSDCYIKVTDMNANPLTKRAIQEFHSTVPNTDYEVLEAYLVQNLPTWAQHQSLEQAWLSGNKVTQQNLNVRWMWHGSYSKTVPEICSKGFLRDYNSTHAYGKGVYFARDAKYPVGNGYARFDDDKTCAHLLYCRVICGESAQGKSDLVRPPSKSSGHEYESLVDVLTNPSIVVCCTDCQAYPVLKLFF